MVDLLDNIKGKYSNFKTIINSAKTYKQVQKKQDVILDSFLRPFSGHSHNNGHLLFPKFGYSMHFLYNFAYESDVLTTIHNALRREIFRNGYDLIEAKNVQDDMTQSEQEVIQPIFEGEHVSREQILDKLENINENEQSIIDVMYELEDDLSIMDDAFMITIFNYTFSNSGKLESATHSQTLRGDPRYMDLVMNIYFRPGYDDDNNQLMVCPVHRHNLLKNETRCSDAGCNLETFPAYYSASQGDKTIYYFKEEVVHRSKYRPSKGRGSSPMLSVWMKARTLMFMDKYINELYDGQRPPKSLLAFKTSNMESLKAMWEEAKNKANENPHHPLIMGVPNDTQGAGGNFVEFIDLMRSLTDLQHTEMRNEYRRQIGAVYGVEPIFQGDNSNGGGLNNEGLQITVTNRTAEYGQGIYNSYFLPKVLKSLALKGMILRLNPSEEQDEMAKIQRQRASLENGQLAVELGLSAKLDENTGEIVIEPGDLIKPEPQDLFGGLSAQTDPFEAPASGTPQKSMSAVGKRTKGNQRPPFTKLVKVIENIIKSFFKKFKRKPTEKELEKEIANINLNLTKELKRSTDELLKKTYIQSADKVGKELSVNFGFESVDKNALEVITNSKVMSDAFVGLSAELTKGVNDIIEDAFRSPKGLTVKQMTDKIKETTDLVDSRAETIARTETSKVSSAARRNSYKKEDPENEFIYKWLGPNDNRTTKTSERIKARTLKGVSWDNLVKAVEEESRKDFPEWTVDKNAPVSHYNSRHSFIRLV